MQCYLTGSPAPLYLPYSLEGIESLDILDGFDSFHPAGKAALPGPIAGCDWDDGYNAQEPYT